jgi:membrane protein YqaA with SNARE-associated domain
VRAFTSWVFGFAAGIGGPGLFITALLDSSFLPLPGIIDSLVVLMVLSEKAWMPYYAAMTTAGSVAGCYVLYLLAEKGGETFLRRRLQAAHLERALASYRRHGLLALILPGLLPPPAPFKLFVLAAGVADVTPGRFVLGITVARGLRYVALGLLAVFYGQLAIDLMATRGRDVALVLIGTVLVGAIAIWLVQRRRGRPERGAD